MDIDALQRSASRLGETAFDPTLWPSLLQDIAENVGAVGAMLLQPGVPTSDVPWSPSLSRAREVYYDEGWNTRDLRAMRSVAAVRRGLTVLTDEDLVSRDEVERQPYYTSFLASHRMPEFAAVVFRSSPSDYCGLVIQRTASQGAFVGRDKQALALLEPRLTAAAELARLLATASLRSTLTVLNRLTRPALALGQAGAVIDLNAAAAALFDDHFSVRAGSLVVRDERAAVEIQRACELAGLPFGSAPQMTEPIIVRRDERIPLILKPLPLDGPAGSFFLGARLLVTIVDPSVGSMPPPGLLRGMFGMTGAEVRLATYLIAGLNLGQSADASGITSETARGQLKSVFSKTGTRRQAELVALLGRL